MYLKRKIDLFLESWHKDVSRLPILLKGARQIGKTEAVRHFAESHYDSVVEINFVEHPKYKRIAADGYGVQEVVAAISRLNPEFRFLKGKRTLIFFDEVQEFPDIATSLKFFAQDGQYDVICSGSLLGVHYRKIASVAVGFKVDKDMYSLDFEEFLWARGYGDDLVDEVLSCMRSRSPLGEATHFALRGLFLDYCTLGGMPYVVRNYIERRSFEGSLSSQRRIVRDYGDDIRKYAEGLDKIRILNVFNHIPVQLANETTIKFQISKVAHGARAREYAPCVEWLRDAGVANVCYALRAPKLPLSGNYDESRYRVFMGDTGLLMGMMDPEVGEDVRVNRNLGIWKGALYENIVAEALVKSGRPLFYWKRDESKLEMDFFVRREDELIPLEVKGGNDSTKSLNEMIRSEKYPDIRWGIKMADANIGFADNKLTLPWFCSFLLDRFLGNDPKASDAAAWFDPASFSGRRSLNVNSKGIEKP